VARSGHGGVGDASSTALVPVSRLQPSPIRVAAPALARTRALAPPAIAFTSFRAQQVDTTAFPPRSVPKIIKLPRLPALTEGPAPLAFGADRAPAGASITGAAAAAMDSMWMTGFLDARGAHDALGIGKPAKARLPGLGGGVGGRRGHASHHAGSGGGGGRDALAAADRDFLEASGEFRRLAAKLKEAMWREEKARLSTSAGAAATIAANPLALENDRIRRALMGGRGGAGGGSPSKLAMRTEGLDRLILLQRVEAQGAIVLQRFWRRHLRKLFWRRFLLEQRCILQIQRLWRGYVVMCRLRAWFVAARYLSTRIQAWWQGHTVRLRVKQVRA